MKALQSLKMSGTIHPTTQTEPHHRGLKS